MKTILFRDENVVLGAALVYEKLVVQKFLRNLSIKR
jgi:hypothetical protein